MTNDHQEKCLSAAQVVELQALENPEISIPVDPELAEFMGAFQEKALIFKGMAHGKEK